MQEMATIFSPLKLICLLIFAQAVGPQHVVPAAEKPTYRPSLILIIRHAEKPDDSSADKDPNLSPQGYARAKALARVIPANFPKPDFLIATKKSKSSDRPIETITPLAQALDEPIESTFKAEEVDELAHTILSDPKYDGKVILIAWHHEKIPALAKALGVKDAPEKWNRKVFDRVWEITYDGDEATWKDLPEKALPGDSQE
jgi:phosphohistidine phosphatase SixA